VTSVVGVYLFGNISSSIRSVWPDHLGALFSRFLIIDKVTPISSICFIPCFIFPLSPQGILNSEIKPSLFYSSIFQSMDSFHLHITEHFEICYGTCCSLISLEYVFLFHKIPCNFFCCHSSCRFCFRVSLSHAPTLIIFDSKHLMELHFE